MNQTEIILIQLIGGQTIPNILPINIIRPNTVYNLCTDKTLQQGLRIGKWIKNKYMGNIRDHLKKLTGTDLLNNTRSTCTKLLEKYKGKKIILNLTGGTKLMSIAMYQAAEQIESASVIYVDNDSEECMTRLKRAHWDTGGTAEVPERASLSIIDMLEIGEQAPAYESIKDWHPLLPAAKAVQELADKITTAGLTTNVSASNQNRKLLSKLRKAALKDKELMESFAAAGCIFTQNSANEEINTNFLGGMWWEVLVADYLERSGKYREVMCSVQTYISAECGITDVDVLATDGRTLTCFSCKRSLKKPDSELSKHATRSRKLGGTYVKSGIAVYDGNEASYTALKNLANAEEMECLTGPEVCPTKQISAVPSLPIQVAGQSAESLLFSERGCDVNSFLS